MLPLKTIYGLHGFGLANAVPVAGNGGNGSVVDSLHEHLYHLQELERSAGLVLEAFGLYLLAHHIAKVLHCRNELWSQPSLRNAVQRLQILFVGRWPDQREAVPLSEQLAELSSNSIFAIHSFGPSLLVFQSVLQVLGGCHGLPLLILKSKREIPHNPQKRWKAIDNIMSLSFAVIFLQHFGEVDDQPQSLYSLFVDTTHTVVQHHRRYQCAHQEYLQIGVLTFLQ